MSPFDPWARKYFISIILTDHYLDIQHSPRLTSEPPHLVNQSLAGLADQDPHPLPVPLYLPGDVGGLRHDAVVGDLGASNHSNSRSTRRK